MTEGNPISKILGEFCKNPFKTKFIPTLISLVLGVVFWAINGTPGSFALWAGVGFWQLLTIDKPLAPIIYYAFILSSAALTAYAVFCLALHAWAAAAISGGASAMPLSVLFTRDVQQKEPV